jgi:hypothetical protein
MSPTCRDLLPEVLFHIRTATRQLFDCKNIVGFLGFFFFLNNEHSTASVYEQCSSSQFILYDLSAPLCWKWGFLLYLEMSLDRHHHCGCSYYCCAVAKAAKI